MMEFASLISFNVKMMPSGQAWLFLSTVVVGMVIGLFYDIFRITRKVAPHSTLAVHFEDAVFWVLATGGMFYFMLHRNYGEIRPFALIGATCGVVLYFATVSRLVLKVSVTVINFVKRVIAAAVRIITLPVRFLFNLFAPPVKKFLLKRRKSLRTVAGYSKLKLKKYARNWKILRKKT